VGPPPRSWPSSATISLPHSVQTPSAPR